MRECIILAGGLGTRLQTVVYDVPKCMAPVVEKPFLEYLFKYLQRENFNHIVLSLGYKSEIVIDWLENSDYRNITDYVIEKEPLGTGGAIQLAFSKIKGYQALIINGDTFFDINTQLLYDFHANNTSDISIALKSMTDFERYGSVEVNSENKITAFREKKFCKKGLINGGVYLISNNIFRKNIYPDKFSFEKDVLEVQIDSLNIQGLSFESYFIDIGIPEDYEKANLDFVNLFF